MTKTNMKKIAILAACAALVGNVKADSIARGQRGPTDIQFDMRASISEKEMSGKKTKGIVNNNVIKYWNGGEVGVWGSVSIPLKNIDTGANESSGFGDISVCMGPRGAFTNKVGSFHFLPYIGASFPTGDSEARPALGNDRYDLKTGTGFTYLTPGKRGEIGAAFEYASTGIGSNRDISDELYGGIVIGGKVHDRIRAAAGVIGNAKMGGIRDGDYNLSSRIAVRYVPKNAKKWHAEIWLDRDIQNKNTPKGYMATGMVRRNF